MKLLEIKLMGRNVLEREHELEYFGIFDQILEY
jgi:hypothetical protein